MIPGRCPGIVITALPADGDQTYLGPARCQADLILELNATREVDTAVRPCFDVDGGYFATGWRVVCEAGHVVLFPAEDGVGYDPSWLEESLPRFEGWTCRNGLLGIGFTQIQWKAVRGPILRCTDSSRRSP